VAFSLVLRLPGRAGLRRYLADAEDPSSPRFHRFLPAAAFGRRFGLPDPAVRAVMADARSAGLRVLQAYPQRTAIRVQGRAADVERFVGAGLGEFRDPAGRRYRAPLARPAVPAILRPYVSGLSGLDTRPLIRPALPPGPLADVPPGGLKPEDLAKAYDIAPLYARGVHGEGQTVAIVSFATVGDADIQAYQRLLGIQSPGFEHVPVDGGNRQPDVEVALDIETVLGIAPSAKILNYEAPNDLGAFADVINRIVSDGRTKIVSMSWGLCESFWPPDARLAVSNAIDAAAAQGITIFVASGDNGGFDCQREDLTNHSPSVSWPADSPSVVSVGGTLLSVNADGSYAGETGWEDVLSNSGGGGGLDPIDRRPDFQQGPGVDNSASNGKRQIPDVSAAADPDSGYLVVFTSKGSLREGIVGGTSAATPFWAGSMALVQQLAAQRGAGPLGFVDPLLYQLAATPQTFPPFHDVTRGGNRLFDATPGWDYSTGLGSPDVFNLARDAVEFLKAHPAS
jgi:kumamolisin